MQLSRAEFVTEVGADGGVGAYDSKCKQRECGEEKVEEGMNDEESREQQLRSQNADDARTAGEDAEEDVPSKGADDDAKGVPLHAFDLFSTVVKDLVADGGCIGSSVGEASWNGCFACLIVGRTLVRGCFCTIALCGDESKALCFEIRFCLGDPFWKVDVFVAACVVVRCC